MKKLLSIVLCLMLLMSGAALADTLMLDGEIAAAYSVALLAPIGGTVKSVPLSAGDRVEADDVVVTLKTEVTYAEQAGTVVYFGQPGDTADFIASTYGAVAWLEPDRRFTISASTRRAYDKKENRMVHPGETVYLQTTGENKQSGVGVVTAVSGSDFTVEVLSGDFDVGETANVYREESHAISSRIGQGQSARVDPVAYGGSGSVVSFLQKNGGHVERGDALFETLDGAFDAGVMTGSAIPAGTAGVLVSVTPTVGSALQKNGAVAEIWPDEAMRLRASAYESDLTAISPGDKVSVELDADTGRLLTGTIEKISMTSSASSGEATYDVWILLDDTEGLRYGMKASATLTAE